MHPNLFVVAKVEGVGLLSELNGKVVVSLFLCSVLAILAHRMGALKVELDLTLPENYSEYGKISSSNVTSALVSDGNQVGVNCSLSDSYDYNFCGLNLTLSEGAPSKGLNIENYDHIELYITYEAPLARPKIRVSLRNFGEAYSKLEDDVSLKFNSVTYQPDKYNAPVIVPLNAFQVENWWVEQYSVGFENGQLDFSNISYLEIVTDNMSNPGEYSIRVLKAKLYGELISEQDLLKIMLIMWLLAIILLITMQRNKLKVISTTDTLTGLLNRRGLQDWVTRNNSHSNSKPLHMFYFDIDDFKKINDSYGHIVGDELLCGFCYKLRQLIPKGGHDSYALSRLSGDEFAIVFKELDTDDVLKLAERIIKAMHSPIALSSNSIKITVSLGIAATDKVANNYHRLIGHADSAMYYAKKSGKNQFKLFDESVSKDIYFRKQVAEKLQKALQQDEFTLNFMPIFDSKTLQIHSAEVLVRCQAESLKGIGPDIFIPIAEEYDMIKHLDLWVIEATFKKISSEQNFFIEPPIKFCINISALELHNPQFTKHLKKLLNKYKIDPNFIELEITETSLIETDERSIAVLNDIRAMGIGLALDDFGTGYTAFNQLVRYPVNCLKIDKSFIDNLTGDNETKSTMVKAIISIAKSYRLQTVAEGIETPEQFNYLLQHQCDYVQGYLFAKPMSWEALCEKHQSPRADNLTYLIHPPMEA